MAVEGAVRTFVARVEVTLKAAVNDPQGNTVRAALASLGFGEVEDVRVGKYLELRLAAPSALEAQQRIDEMCQRLLANPVIEQYRFSVGATGD